MGCQFCIPTKGKYFGEQLPRGRNSLISGKQRRNKIFLLSSSNKQGRNAEEGEGGGRIRDFWLKYLPLRTTLRDKRIDWDDLLTSWHHTLHRRYI